MSWFARRALSDEQVGAIVAAVESCSADDAAERAWKLAAPLVSAQARQPRAALALLRLIGGRRFVPEQSLDALRAVFEAHQQHAALVAEMLKAYEGAHEIRYLNAAPPADPLPAALANRALALLPGIEPELEGAFQAGLGTLARLLGRHWDVIAERAYRRVIELSPDDWRHHYDLGLFFKTRGRFAEGVEANQQACSRGGAQDEGVRWNLGICATGAGDARLALEVWQSIGQKITLGRFGLPEGGYPAAKVRLSARPLAERDPREQPDDPGEEETIWVERLSPCHGIIRSVLYADLGVDYGDVVLFDGAPVTYHKLGESSVPVFPQLATLVRNGYQRFAFAGTQEQEGQLADLSEQLPDDAVVYSHTESVVIQCPACWEDTQLDHAQHHPVEHRMVVGKICAPPTLDAKVLLDALDASLAGQRSLRLFVPELCAAAGDRARADVARRRLEMLVRNQPSENA